MKIIERIKKSKLLFFVALAYGTLFIVVPETAVQSFGNSVYYLKEMLEILPVIFLLTVIIEAWVPKEVIMKRFGAKSGFGGHILSFVLGSLSAGPIYAAFPISKALLGKGASVTNIVIIISSWAVIKVPMLANEAKFLGPKFMLTRWLLTVVAIFIMAKLAAVIMKNDKMQSSVTGTFESLVIKKDYCVGCCLCTKLLPGTYEMKNNKATVIALPANPEFLDLIHQSVQQCPTQAIVFTPTASENY